MTESPRSSPYSAARVEQLLTRIRQGIQDRSDLDLLGSTCYQDGRRIPWESGITAVTTTNRNRWNLNMEATLSFQKQHHATVRIFLSEHKWKDGEPTEEEQFQILNHGGDSTIPVPGLFIYTALEVILDKAYPGYRVSEHTILHFGPPAGILLTGETTREFHFVHMPRGTILLTPISTNIECQSNRPWQQSDVVRNGLPCTAAFAYTDYRVQGRTLERPALESQGTRTTNIGDWAEARERDFVGNEVPESIVPSEESIVPSEESMVPSKESIVAALERLELLSNATIAEAETWDWSGWPTVRNP